MTATSPRPATRALWAMLFGNLIIGTGVLLPAGLLGAFMADYAVDASRAGLLMFVGGLVVGIGAPVLAGLTTRVDRRILLVASLLIYAAGHLGAMLTTDFTMLLLFRAITVIGAALFTPQAAATVGLLVPADQRGSAIAFIFIGWSLASVLGIPLGSVLGEAIGWRQTYLLMAGLSAVAAGVVWVVLPGGLRVQRIDLSSWLRVLTDPRLMVVLAVTMFAMSGQFAMFTYVSPVLTKVYGQTGHGVALTFLVVGAAGVCGNYAASRLAGQFGVERSVLLALSLIAIGLAVVALAWGSYPAFLVGGCLWGLGGFASNSLQQSRLVGLAPALASATVALNTSFVYLGQSLGSATGGRLIAAGPQASMAWAGFTFILAAMGLSVWAARRGAR